MDLQTFVDMWSKAGAAERAHKDKFLDQLTEVLGVPKPEAKTNDPDRDRYVFEHDVPTLHEGGKVTTRKIDLYKHGCFILEAKQGSNTGDKKLGFAKRETDLWHVGMSDAYGQALGYASSMDEPPPFIVICDIGHCFDLYASFDRGPHRPFPNALNKRIWFRDLLKDPKKHLDTLRRIWTDPLSLDPALHAAKVTREVAESIADLARSLEAQGHPSEVVAKFLMRCLFTMFSEDVGLLPERTFTKLIKDYWLPNPPSFAGPGGVGSLWQAMNDGSTAPLIGKILRFNGGLFADTSAIPLKRADLQLLLKAAERDWTDVEPAIFGTLLERALNPKERHMLGAHFTPRAYVERLVRPTIEEPLREEWENVQAEVRQIVLDAGAEPVKPALTEEEYLQQGRGKKKQRGVMEKYAQQVKAREEKLEAARAALRAFLHKLTHTRVLDPACGSGNFLYVALDLFKRIEAEVLAALRSVGVVQEMLAADALRVTPGQFLGIEVKPWAKEIAELVLWIGYLQWHYKSHGKALPPPEPVLMDYKNFACRDAVLAWDSVELVTDDKGKPITRWDGETYKKSLVTGEDVPDEAARVPVYEYIGPRKATWPNADYVVGNPPFIGNKRMRQMLGDGYVEALRAAHSDVPDSADYVMYWWNQAARSFHDERLQRFGLITTNSITQAFNRKVLQQHLVPQGATNLLFAIPDHPWVDSANGAAVRIAMTVAAPRPTSGRLVSVVSEEKRGDADRRVILDVHEGKIHPDLTVGPSLTGMPRLQSNRGLSCPGVQLSGQGFVLTEDKLSALRPDTRARLLRRYYTGRDLTQTPRTQYVIDTYGMTEDALRRDYPDAYQWLVERVLPDRQQNPRSKYAREWWLHSEPRSKFRAALSIPRFIGTSRTARHRVFQFLDGVSLPETKVLIVALHDAWHLGVVSSRAHVVFATAAGGWLGVGNDSTYNHTSCFDPFPFPDCTKAQQKRIGDLGEALDAHRKNQQAQHPELTITGMYNVLEKLRAREPLSEKDKRIHEEGLVSTLKQIHDDLDAAVFDAYGWPADLTDEQLLEKLVALNADRAEEETRGIVRWLRPSFQEPAEQPGPAAGEVASDEAEPEPISTPEIRAWPKKLAERVVAVRDRVTNSRRSLMAHEVAVAFTRAPRKDVEEILESLVAVGVLVEVDAEGGKRWRATARQA